MASTIYRREQIAAVTATLRWFLKKRCDSAQVWPELENSSSLRKKFGGASIS